MRELEDEDLYSAGIGPSNRAYYLRKFHRFARKGTPLVDWNLPGFLFGFLWFLYRQIWFFVTPYLVLVLSAKFWVPSSQYLTFWIAVLALERIAGGLFGNQIYFRWISSKISRVSRRKGNRGEVLETLKKRGGTVTEQDIGN